MKESVKRRIADLVIVLAVTGFTVWYLIKKDVFNADSIKNTSAFSLAIVFLVNALSLFLVSLTNFLTVKRDLKGFGLFDAVSDEIFGKLGSSITPLKSGHYPLRVYFYKKRGYDFYEALTVLCKCQIIASVASVVNYAAVLVVSAVKGLTMSFNGKTVGLWLIMLIGVLFHALTILLVMLIAFVNPVQKFFINFIAKIKFFKKSKDEKQAYIETETLKYKIYKEQTLIMLKSFYRYLLPLFLYIVNMFVTSSTAYAAYLTTVKTASFTLGGFLSFYLLTIGAAYITNVIPIPGGNGSSEIVFTLVFSASIGVEHIGAALISWRAGSYFMPVIVSAVWFFILSAALTKKADKRTDKNVRGETNGSEYGCGETDGVRVKDLKETE